MPILNEESMENFQAASGFQFSATSVSNLAASEYTLFGLAADKSGSLTGFDQEIEAAVRSVFESCQRSPRADNLMARLLTFNHSVEEVHGFKPLADCHPGNYQGIIRTGGGTALYDASTSLIDSLAAYGKTLIAQDYQVNGIAVIVTDGLDESSARSVGGVKDAIDRAMKSESLESLVTILIGVNVQNQRVSEGLKKFKTDAGIREYIEVQDATPKTLAKIAGFIAQSVSSQSQSVGTKQASQPIIF